MIPPRKLALAAVVGAAYAALTVLLAPISFPAVQFRVSELLCILPFFFPCTAWGLFVGCAIANIFGGSVLDIVFGSLATLFAGLLTAWLGKRKYSWLSCILGCFREKSSQRPCFGRPRERASRYSRSNRVSISNSFTRGARRSGCFARWR